MILAFNLTKKKGTIREAMTEIIKLYPDNQGTQM
jgi:hypothetical protein